VVALQELDRRDHPLAVQLAGIATAVITEASRSQTLRTARTTPFVPNLARRRRWR
jgi:hypothetical protein